MTVRNPFLLAVSLMLLAAAVYAAWQGDWPMVAFNLGIAVANGVIAVSFG